MSTKNISEIVACVVDCGTFPSIAEKLAEACGRVYYNSPWDSEYLNICDCVVGDGLAKVERLDEFMAPEKVKEIDLFVFPDRGFCGHQEYLRSIGKPVWGSFSASEIELYRTRFLKLIEEVGLPVVPYDIATGVDELRSKLKKVERKWIKVNRYRANMETWFHIDWEHSQDMLGHLEVEFSTLPVVFVIQDEIPDAREIGYDGWNIHGHFPESSFQGYEKKNELYLGALKKYPELPEEVRFINEKMAPFLESHGYANFWATELRVAEGIPYFIDPTPRMPGQTGEQLLETCTNLAEVIWQGANGRVIRPEWSAKYALEATLHYTAGGADDWKVFRLPEGMGRWVKLYQYVQVDKDLYKFPPGKNDELGVVLGLGDTPAGALGHLKENLEALKREPVKAELAGFVDLAKEIELAEKEDMHFTDEPLPEAEEVLT